MRPNCPSSVWAAWRCAKQWATSRLRRAKTPPRRSSAKRSASASSRPEMEDFVLCNAARDFLRSGITTIRDVGCYDDNAIILREAIRLGLTEGPTVLSCGRIVSATAPGAVLFKSMYEEADGPWQIRQCVRNQL